MDKQSLDGAAYPLDNKSNSLSARKIVVSSSVDIISGQSPMEVSPTSIPNCNPIGSQHPRQICCTSTSPFINKQRLSKASCPSNSASVTSSSTTANFNATSSTSTAFTVNVMDNQQLKGSDIPSDTNAINSQNYEVENPKTLPAKALLSANSLISLRRGELQELIIRRIDAPAEEKAALESRRRSLAREIMILEKQEKRRKDKGRRGRKALPPDDNPRPIRGLTISHCSAYWHRCPNPSTRPERETRKGNFAFKV